jgi:hypothetical protein
MNVVRSAAVIMFPPTFEKNRAAALELEQRAMPLREKAALPAKFLVGLPPLLVLKTEHRTARLYFQWNSLPCQYQSLWKLHH